MKENDPIIRAHAVWALGEYGGWENRVFLEKFKLSEKDERVSAEIESVLTL